VDLALDLGRCLDHLHGRTQPARGCAQLPEHARMRLRAETVPPGAMPLALRRAALAAVQPAHAASAHGRLPATAAIRLPPRLAARRIGRVAAPDAVPQRFL
jgi:hypothetical protein